MLLLPLFCKTIFFAFISQIKHTKGRGKSIQKSG